MRLPSGTTSGRIDPQTEMVPVFHGGAPVYYPAPGGGSYCNFATCTHDHKTPGQAEECSERLARIIFTGRLPQWATLSNPI